MSYAVLFPGQGSQFVGMGADLFEARPDLLVDKADEILGWSLRDVCLDGPEEELTRTERAQPALFALAYVIWDELNRVLPVKPAAAAGHSLGEYTALAAAGAMEFETALALVASRGIAMAIASDQAESMMAALIGVGSDRAEEIVSGRRDGGGRLWVANLNAPGQIVVGGGKDDIDWLHSHGRELGVRRVIPLKVAGAFHTPFMAPAAEQMRDKLAQLVVDDPSFPVWSNVSAAPAATSEVADLLARQVTAPVRFSDTLEGMAAEGIQTFVHVGPGDVTAGMARRAVLDGRVLIVNEIGAIGDAVAQLKGGGKEGP